MQLDAKTQGRRRSLVSLTPLIDVVFILLIFFMLALSFSREHTITMLTPPATHRVPAGEAGAALVRIGLDGGVDLNGTPVARSELVRQVAAWARAGRSRGFLVEPAPGVTVQQTVTLVDLLKTSGARNVSLIRK